METQDLTRLAAAPNASQEIKDLALALATAQKEFPAIHKSSTAKAGSFSYKYAGLPAVIDGIKETLSKNGLSFTQLTSVEGGGFVLITLLMHKSGQWLTASYPLPMGIKPQELGSALTYARRYSLCAILGVAADDDDDASMAQNSTPKAKAFEGYTGRERAPDITKSQAKEDQLPLSGDDFRPSGGYVVKSIAAIKGKVLGELPTNQLTRIVEVLSAKATLSDEDKELLKHTKQEQEYRSYSGL